VLRDEKTFGDTLALIRRLSSKRFLLSPIEEPDGISFSLGH